MDIGRVETESQQGMCLCHAAVKNADRDGFWTRRSDSLNKIIHYRRLFIISQCQERGRCVFGPPYFGNCIRLHHYAANFSLRAES
ncbi:hypothetical protein HDF10_001756 [Edaphobacter lichenicola]|uniref:Uncharacterized protein n=1 Tax=Tunturiibacter lichenicola TaxID=2051959 RepID=A0A7W8J789_9BACT|nr:hypothetical protein [Edaphobacter lichenicola]